MLFKFIVVAFQLSFISRVGREFQSNIFTTNIQTHPVASLDFSKISTKISKTTKTKPLALNSHRKYIAKGINRIKSKKQNCLFEKTKFCCDCSMVVLLGYYSTWQNFTSRMKFCGLTLPNELTQRTSIAGTQTQQHQIGRYKLHSHDET